MTNDEFVALLQDLVVENAHTLLSVPGVYEAVSEHFNNEVLDLWAEGRKSLTCPEDEDAFRNAYHSDALVYEMMRRRSSLKQIVVAMHKRHNRLVDKLNEQHYNNQSFLSAVKARYRDDVGDDTE